MWRTDLWEGLSTLLLEVKPRANPGWTPPVGGDMDGAAGEVALHGNSSHP